MFELLTPAQMNAADRQTIDGGVAGYELMKAAGRAVAEAAQRLTPEARRVHILAGTGNNGGDGFVAAKLLNDAWRDVRVTVIGDVAAISGDAKLAFDKWDEGLSDFSPEALADADLVIDALFGAGLSRPIEGPLAEMIEAINRSGKPVLSVDLPSGVDGGTGEVRGAAIKAAATMTFFRKKPGHLLFPGRGHCGRVHVADIGIPAGVLAGLEINTVENTPWLWRGQYPVPGDDGHKFTRGHSVVLSGPAHATGAARLSAGAALRAGAGLVTLASPADAMAINAAHLTAVMLREVETAEHLSEMLGDPRVTSVLLGPGLGVGERTRDMVSVAAKAGKRLVLDADALTSFESAPDALFAHIGESAGAILTPHEGEFGRLFGRGDADKMGRARHAAERSGAVVILKGADTVVASPDGRCSINANAPPWLATAGSGDVLAGIAAGLLASGMPVFEAASAAVWLHGLSGQVAGPGLTAEDLDAALKTAIASLFTS